jgi:succinate dehydrogenase / fumarate reductase cytochrome b subunit
MIWSGLGILLYVLYHLLHFTIIATNPEYATLTDAAGRFDVYSMVILSYQNYLISAVYLVAMFALAFHINHALPSLLQTLGLTRPEYRTCLKRVGNLAAVLFFFGYASMPVAVLLNLISLPGGN